MLLLISATADMGYSNYENALTSYAPDGAGLWSNRVSGFQVFDGGMAGEHLSSYQMRNSHMDSRLWCYGEHLSGAKR